MKRVGAQVGGEPAFSMALRALAVVILEALELIIWIAVVHRVAGQTGNFSTREAAGNGQSGVFPTAGQDRAIVPPAFAEKLAVPFQVCQAIWRRIRGRILNVVARAVQIFARTIQDSLVGVLHGKLVGLDEDAVALSTNFARP